MSGPGDEARVAESERRASLFAAGPPRIPRKAIWITLAFAAIFGIGGAFADHSFNVDPTAAPTPVAHTASERQTLAEFIGLKTLTPRSAPALRLTDDRGKPFSLAQDRGRPTLLTFLGAACSGICPVVVAELREAEADLQRDHVSVAVVVVNADPQRLSPAAVRSVDERPPLSSLVNASFVTGSLTELEPVWRAYGVTIDLDPTTHALAYTDVIYLITPSGELRESVSPFANESFSGSSSLPQADIDRFGSGIADYVVGLAR